MVRFQNFNGITEFFKSKFSNLISVIRSYGASIKDNLFSLGLGAVFFFLIVITLYFGIRFTDVLSINTFSLLWQGHWWQPEHFGWDNPGIVFTTNFILWLTSLLLLFFWLQYMFSDFIAYIVCLLLAGTAFRYELLLDNYYRLLLFNFCWGLTSNIFLIWFLTRRDKRKYFYLTAFLVSCVFFFLTTPVHMIFIAALFITIVRYRYYKPQRILPLSAGICIFIALMFYMNDYIVFPAHYQFIALSRLIIYFFYEIRFAAGKDFVKFFPLSFQWINLASLVIASIGGVFIIRYWRRFRKFTFLLLIAILAMAADFLFNAYLYIPLNGTLYLKSGNLFFQSLLFLFLTLAGERAYDYLRNRSLAWRLAFIPVVTGVLVFWQISSFAVFSTPLHYLVRIGHNVGFQVRRINTLLVHELHGSAGETDYAQQILKERSPVDYYFYLIGHYISRDERDDLLYLYQSLKLPDKEIRDELLLMIAAYFITIEEYEVVEEILDPYSSMEKPPRAYYFFQAQLYVQKAQYHQLVDFLEEHEDYIPEEDLYYFNGLLYYMQGDFDLARESFENIPQTLWRFPYASFLMGRIFYYQQQYAQALTYFQRAYEGNFLSSALYLDYINCLLETHQFEEAIDMINEALDLYPEDRRFLMLAGMTYLDLGKHYWYRFYEPFSRQYFLEKAMNVLDMLVQQEPEDAYPYYLYAKSAVLLQNWKEARWSIERALERQPKNIEYLVLEFDIALRTKDTAQAKELRRHLYMEYALSDEDLVERIPNYYRLRNEVGLPEL